MRALAALAIWCACAGSSTPAPELVVVAHQDDDLLFMHQDLFDVVRNARPVVVVYVTAGDNGNGLAYVQGRDRGARFAYGAVAGSQRWTCDDTTLAGHLVTRCTLDDRPVTLLFLGYPDGGINGDHPTSLLNLWEGVIPRADTVAEQPTSYSRDELIETVTTIIETTHPRTIRTLELAGTHGYDHSDHMMVGALTELALARSSVQGELLSYRGYNINNEPTNVPEEDVATSSLFFRAYSACVAGCGACGEKPCETIDDDWYNGFLRRRYVVGMVDDASGVLSSPSGCIGFPREQASIVPCVSASQLVLDDSGLIHVGDRCLEVDATNRVQPGDCAPAANRFFQLDVEGHLWSGVSGVSGASLFDHTPCVMVDAGTIGVGMCGQDRDWRWALTK